MNKTRLLSSTSIIAGFLHGGRGGPAHRGGGAVPGAAAAVRVAGPHGGHRQVQPGDRQEQRGQRRGARQVSGKSAM